MFVKGPIHLNPGVKRADNKGAKRVPAPYLPGRAWSDVLTN